MSMIITLQSFLQDTFIALELARRVRPFSLPNCPFWTITEPFICTIFLFYVFKVFSTGYAHIPAVHVGTLATHITGPSVRGL